MVILKTKFSYKLSFYVLFWFIWAFHLETHFFGKSFLFLFLFLQNYSPNLETMMPPNIVKIETWLLLSGALSFSVVSVSLVVGSQVGFIALASNGDPGSQMEMTHGIRAIICVKSNKYTNTGEETDHHSVSNTRKSKFCHHYLQGLTTILSLTFKWWYHKIRMCAS